MAQNVYFQNECIEVDDAVFEEFASKYQQIPAGGGVVRNSEGSYLMILRHGIWDLPKGKQEPGETIEACALREVEEETGLKELKLGKLICVTHHTYKVFGASVLKHTHWFEMTWEGTEKPVPQEEEDITDVAWVAPSDIPSHIASTFPSIAEVFSKL